jgi:uncharacterized PurR-regulated membrane protein YhhQ (DUF165 family)
MPGPSTGKSAARTAALVSLYLAAIVAANLSAERWGLDAVVINAFLFIGLDLTCRDALHDAWKTHLAPKMGALIAAGGLLSWFLNADAGRIALASTLAFAAAASVDAIAYHLLRDRPWLERANLSNVPSAAVDSVVFPWVAFGAVGFLVVFPLFAAKLAGGMLWSLVLNGRRRVAAARV